MAQSAVMGTVYVLMDGWRQAQCTCGWQGKKRLLRGRAVVDAYMHCGETGHTPAGSQEFYATRIS